MMKSGKGLIWTAAVPVILALATSGCASKKYVSQQISPLKQKMSQDEAQNNDRFAWLTNQQKNDMSQVSERIATTDQRVAEVATAVQKAQGTASRAMEEAGSNRQSISTLQSGVANALNYQLVEKADVLFAFGKATLTPAAMASLDKVAAKIQSLPRAVVEVAGFTDPIGTEKYNLDLSRRRAWAVQRYLVQHNVPSRSIHMVGMGEEAAPEGMEHSFARSGKTGAKAYWEDRRVNIRVFGAGDLTAPTAPTPSQE
jgi:outer membrane protein OmpA-like peptidoglycan-associated protein